MTYYIKTRLSDGRILCIGTYQTYSLEDADRYARCTYGPLYWASETP